MLSFETGVKISIYNLMNEINMEMQQGGMAAKN